MSEQESEDDQTESGGGKSDVVYSAGPPLIDESLDDPTRQRGIFTEREREYLLGKISVDGQQERTLRYRMRQHLHHGLLDLVMMQHTPWPTEADGRPNERVKEGDLPESLERVYERDMPFPLDDLKQVVTSHDDFQANYVLSMLAELAFHIAYLTPEDERVLDHVDYLTFLEMMLREGIDRGYTQQHPDEKEDVVREVDVDISVETERVGKEELRLRILTGEASVEELGTYAARFDLTELYRTMYERELVVELESSSGENLVLRWDELPIEKNRGSSDND